MAEDLQSAVDATNHPEPQGKTSPTVLPEVRSKTIGVPQPVNGCQPRRILLAEDVASNRTLICAFLSKLGVEFATAENGAQVVEQAQRERFDAVLMDIQMPVMDGITATKMLRTAGFDRPIVALTGNVTTADVALYLQAGCTHCLSKPVDFDRLAQLLAQVLRLELQELRDDSALSFEDDPSGLQAIKRAFEVSLPDRLANLQACITENNWDEVEHLAHALKGTAGSFGYSRVTDMARELERAARHADAGRAISAMLQLSMLDEVQELQKQ